MEWNAHQIYTNESNVFIRIQMNEFASVWKNLMTFNLYLYAAVFACVCHFIVIFHLSFSFQRIAFQKHRLSSHT